MDMKIEIKEVTQSEISLWDDCPEKWYRAYAQQLELKNAKPSWSLIYGTAVHQVIDDWWQGKTIDFANLQLDIPTNCILDADDEAEKQYYTALLRIQMARYTTYYQDDKKDLKIISNEQILSLPYEGFILKGKIDRVWKDKKKVVLCDTKTAGRISMETYEGWHFKFQFMFYVWLLFKCTGQKVDELIVDAVVKPALRRKQNESVQDLHGRILSDMIQEPKKYFQRVPLTIYKGTLERFEEEILRPKINRLKLLTSNTDSAIVDVLTRNKNTNNCHKYGTTCSFLPLCVHGPGAEMFRYVKRDIKHVELSDSE